MGWISAAVRHVEADLAFVGDAEAALLAAGGQRAAPSAAEPRRPRPSTCDGQDSGVRTLVLHPSAPPPNGPSLRISRASVMQVSRRRPTGGRHFTSLRRLTDNGEPARATCRGSGHGAIMSLHLR